MHYLPSPLKASHTITILLPTTKGLAFNHHILLRDGLKVAFFPIILLAILITAHVASLSSSISNLRSNSYPSPSGSSSTQAWQQGSSASYLDIGSAPAFSRPLSPPYTNYSPTTASSAGASPISEIVPSPRHRISPDLSRDQPGSGRAAGNRPTGVQKCSSCKATSSPEWRKGPSGKKELCNA